MSDHFGLPQFLAAAAIASSAAAIASSAAVAAAAQPLSASAFAPPAAPAALPQPSAAQPLSVIRLPAAPSPAASAIPATTGPGGILIVMPSPRRTVLLLRRPCTSQLRVQRRVFVRPWRLCACWKRSLWV